MPRDVPLQDSASESRPYCTECLKPLTSWTEPHSISECIEHEAQIAFARHEEGDDG